MPDTDAHTLGSVAELERMARDLHTALAGEGFRRRRRMVLPSSRPIPEGFPRVALLTMGEVRANSDFGARGRRPGRQPHGLQPRAPGHRDAALHEPRT